MYVHNRIIIIIIIIVIIIIIIIIIILPALNVSLDGSSFDF